MGGREFKNTTAVTRPIKKDEIDATLDYLAQISGIERKDLHALGSAGKKAESGDLDIGISPRKAKADEVHAKLLEALGEDHGKFSPGFNTYTYSLPIAGDPGNGRVQIDLMYNNVSFLKFTHFSAGDASKYKGWMRSRLLATLATKIPDESRKTLTDPESGEEIVKARLGLDVNRGLKVIVRHRPMRKDGKGRKKNFESISVKEANSLYPELDLDPKREVIKSPKQITEILFGKGVTPRNIETAEQVIDLIQEKHPTLKDELFKHVKSVFAKDHLEVPEEILRALGASAEQVEKAGKKLAQSNLPKPELEWRQFRRPRAGKSTQVWDIRQEGDSLYVRHGVEGGKINETGVEIRPGSVGVEGTASYRSAEENCSLELERRIKKKLDAGYGELLDGQVVTAPTSGTSIEFDSLLSSNLRFYKPENSIKEELHRKIYDSGNARYTRKYDGNSTVLVHHEHGWEIYTLGMKPITANFPEAIDALAKTDLGVGTILQAEVVMFHPERPEVEDYGLVSSYRALGSDKAREARESGEYPEPAFVIFDAVFLDGRDLSNSTYDERSEIWKQFPVARGGEGPLLSVEYFDLNPDNWKAEAERMGIEGFVLTDGLAIPGEKFWAVGGKNPRPKGSYKLKPDYEEDLTVYAVRLVNGRYESLFTKQRFPDTFPESGEPHPQAGEWFSTGRVSVANSKTAQIEIEELVKAGKIVVVPDNKQGEAISLDQPGGVVAMVPFLDRYKSQKLRHAKWAGPARFRDDKEPHECVAQLLFEKPVVEEEAA